VSLLISDQLLDALQQTKKQVKVFEFNSRDFIFVSATTALALAASGDYQGGGNLRRCRYLRPISAPRPSPTTVWQECFRTTKAAVLPPSPEFLCNHTTTMRRTSKSAKCPGDAPTLISNG
jgi:hypothetical protein